jgi:uncharacterized protein YhhL (DUF1145 family)
VFALRSTGFGLNEVLISLLDRARPVPALRRFTILLAGIVTMVLLVMAATPLGAIWFSRISTLPPPLVALSCTGLWLAAPIPAMTAFQSLYQGAVVHAHRTRAVTESVVVYLVVVALVLGFGMATHSVGLYVATAAMSIANLAQLAVLATRGRRALESLESRAGATVS